MRKTIALMVLALALTSCAMVNKSLDRFIGADSNDVRIEWGTPHEVLPDGAGGEVWIYRGSGMGYYVPPTAVTTFQGNVAVTTFTPEILAGIPSYRVFYVRDGRVYRYAWRGLVY